MIVVIDYRAGNLYNVGNVLRFLGKEFVFSGDPEVVGRADRVILPGVGSAASAMESLREQNLIGTLVKLRVPFLGICLGLQLLFESSEEDQTPCLGVLQGTVQRFDDRQLKVPHIGWNQVSGPDGSSQLGRSLLKGVPANSYFYFVHSYYAPVDPAHTVGVTHYGETLASVVCQGNFWGVQFHPERSGEMGLRLLRNFADMEAS